MKKEIPNGKKSLNFSKISGFGDKLLYVSNHRGIDLKNKRGLSDKNTPMKKARLEDSVRGRKMVFKSGGKAYKRKK